MTDTRACKECAAELPNTTEFFYRNKGNKYGLTTKCKPCVNRANQMDHERRKAEDPDRIRTQGAARAKKHYWKDLEKSRKRQREAQARYRSDPVKGLLIKARKRAGGLGLSPEELEAIFQAQGCKCAICGSEDPGSKAGWNVDHCHQRNKVRFVLCAHCNRGLGGFRDNPKWLRKVADMLDQFNAKQGVSNDGKYQNQANKPVEAVFEGD